MSDGSVRSKSRPGPRQRSIYMVHYGLQRRTEEVMARPITLPFFEADVRAYPRQVAGHMKCEDEKYLGVLQCNNGKIMKPIIRESHKREVDFYEKLSSSTNHDLVELRKLVPAYYGVTKFTYNGHEQEYVVLEDLAERMLEPCIMDIKIGKRTWDPLASEEKIAREQGKYFQCKQQYSFCIPGFQVYDVSSGKLSRYGKDYGKKLHGPGVVNALRTYLNGDTDTPLCRALILQFLSRLWRVQAWSKRQRSVRLYCASLLLVYDAAKLRSCCGDTDEWSVSHCRQSRLRRNSFHSLHSDSSPTFSGSLSNNGPVYRKVNSVPITPMSVAQTSFTTPSPISSPWSEALAKLHHNHSFDHNYEDKLCKMKMNYRALLDQLSTDSPSPNPWGTVRIIDFAHAFFNEEGESQIDENFKEGIDSLVAIFEQFLSETDDQVF